MTKWADYCISHKRMNDADTHIVTVYRYKDDGESLSDGRSRTRAEIVKAIKKGVTYVTVTKTTDGKWSKGQPVNIVKINGVEYIKTTSNSKAADNLDNLPDF